MTSTRPPVDEIIEEIAATRITERGATRADDRASEAAMEDRKKEGYLRPSDGRLLRFRDRGRSSTTASRP